MRKVQKRRVEGKEAKSALLFLKNTFNLGLNIQFVDIRNKKLLTLALPPCVDGARAF